MIWGNTNWEGFWVRRINKLSRPPVWHVLLFFQWNNEKYFKQERLNRIHVSGDIDDDDCCHLAL